MRSTTSIVTAHPPQYGRPTVMPAFVKDSSPERLLLPRIRAFKQWYSTGTFTEHLAHSQPSTPQPQAAVQQCTSIRTVVATTSTPRTNNFTVQATNQHTVSVGEQDHNNSSHMLAISLSFQTITCTAFVKTQAREASAQEHSRVHQRRHFRRKLPDTCT